MRTWKKELHAKNAIQVLINAHSLVILILISAIIALYIVWPWGYWWQYEDDTLWYTLRTYLGYFGIFEFKYKIIGSLFLIPLIYATAIFRWRGTLFTWILYALTVIPLMVHLHLSAGWVLRNTTFMLIPLALLIIISFEGKRRSNLARQEAERQKYMSEVLKAQEDERQHLAQELHDDIIQRLLVMANSAQDLVSFDYDENVLRIKKGVSIIRDEVLAVSNDLRRVSINLRPSVLDNMGLVAALTWLIDNMQKHTNINTRIHISGIERQLSSQANIILFRIVQEALNNVRRHSKATLATVILEYFLESIKLQVRDNGCGFCLPESLGTLVIQNKLGIVGIREKAKLMNGTLDIHSGDDGTTLTINANC